MLRMHQSRGASSALLGVIALACLAASMPAAAAHFLDGGDHAHSLEAVGDQQQLPARTPAAVPCGHQLVSEESHRWSEAHSRWRAAQEAASKDTGPDAASALEPAPTAAADADADADAGADADADTASASPPRGVTPRALAEKVSPGSGPLRIWVEYQGITNLEQEVAQKLRDTINIALGVLQKYFRVRRPAADILLAPALCVIFDSAGYCNQFQPDLVNGGGGNSGARKLGSCGLATINGSHIAPYRQCTLGGGSCVEWKGGSGEHTDYYLYITAMQDDHCDSGAVAWALPCLYDTTTNRPLLGSANICPNNLAGADPEAAVSVLVHELMHALGFTDDALDKFVDASGAPVPKDQVVREFTDVYGKRTSMIISPTVVKETRAQFGCATLQGAALENEGGQGSANAHWEYRWFQGELMVATNLFAVYGKPATMSRITLAYMQDTGWYDVNWDQAGFLDWGFKAGCDFVMDTCDAYIKAHPEQKYFCTKQDWQMTTNSVCTFDGLARAKCEDAQFADGCIMKVGGGGGG
ncbi:leishmanolysin-like peptidase [Monoraphidium neglectum]|uniref:Leishmanolysin-like peptidase n=1 Tax=Monoraphidium neglectum TaxID=145388 RepID=A0A0D2KA43_9CHLO|nr:leishmanolysin-like peptidase [Monoraphidium neglectum]KIZ07138.1 leishmanolysin-like peptidase [Monoraphidium neglectum]|eukprot:XP_013906157.1 leishmanolysin-like peptidase [Monoraphidium neglectum]